MLTTGTYGIPQPAPYTQLTLFDDMETAVIEAGKISVLLGIDNNEKREKTIIENLLNDYDYSNKRTNQLIASLGKEEITQTLEEIEEVSKENGIRDFGLLKKLRTKLQRTKFDFNSKYEKRQNKQLARSNNTKELQAKDEEIKRLQEEVNNFKNKQYKEAEDIDSVYLVTTIAKEKGLTAQELNQILHDRHIQYKRDGLWVLYERYAGEGYAKIRYNQCQLMMEELNIFQSKQRNNLKLIILKFAFF